MGRFINVTQVLSFFLIFILFFLTLFVFSKLLGPVPFNVNSVTTNKTDSFSVNGEAMVDIKPDIAIVRVGVRSSGATVQAAQDLLNVSINKVTEAVKAQGVAEGDIKTENYNINPIYDARGEQRITSYEASSTLVINVKDINKVNGVIDSSTAAGANQVGGITFDTADKTAAENQARVEAVADAKKKAEEASKVAGFSLGRLINYYENFDNGVQPLGYGGTERSAVAQDIAPTQVQPGSNQLRITVTLSYEVR